MDDECVVRVGPELADHHPGGLQAGLVGREDDVGATGQAELGAGAGPRVVSGCWSALVDASPRLDFRTHDPLVRLHPLAPALGLGLGGAVIPGQSFAAGVTAARCWTNETLETVAGVTSSSQPARGGPLQDHRGLVHHGDELLRG